MSSRSGFRRGVVEQLFHERGYGFIRADNVDYFFHLSGLNGCKMHDLSIGAPVRFVVVDRPKGPRAENVELVER